MKVNDWLHHATKHLEAAGIATARLDCLVLLEDSTGKDRSYLLAHPETPIQGQSLLRLNKFIKRRAGHEPLAYIRGKTDFYGRTFMVNAHTLEPRPETETMIDLLMQITKGDATVIDVGTGSGAIAITNKLENPGLQVVATDISAECLKVAKKNARVHEADIKFYQGDLIDALPPSAFRPPPSQFAILANLPYVPNDHTINKAAMFEPKTAIFGGKDGLDLYRQLFSQIDSLDNKPRFVFTESLPFQHKDLTQIANKYDYKLKTSEDFIQLFERF